jgi:hypothetical protein
MSKTFYIDSENVGECWIDLLLENPDCRFMVFFTDKSPRVDYEHLVKLMNSKNKPELIPCHKGNNALDFQLVTYLGYQLCSKKDSDTIIVSNDTGFDAVVDFWTGRGKKIERISTINPDDATLNFDNDYSSSVDGASALQAEKQNVYSYDVKNEVDTIVNCLGIKNTSHIHHVLMHFYGNVHAEILFNHITSSEFEIPVVNWKRATKIKKFCQLIFAYSDTEHSEIPDDLYSFLCSSVTAADDNASMQKKIKKKYGENSAQLHTILTPFYQSIAVIA